MSCLLVRRIERAVSERTFLLAARWSAAAAVWILISGVCAAANYTWDSSGGNFAAPVDGGGNWSTTAANWSTGSADVVWPAPTPTPPTAVFGNGGTAGMVTIASPVTAAGLTFNAVASGNYTLSGGGPSDTLTLAQPATIAVASGLSPTINATISGTNGLAVSGADVSAMLTLGGANNYTGGTNLQSGTLAITSDAAINSGAGGIAFNGGALQFNNYSSNLSFNDDESLSLGAAAGAPSTLSGNITGATFFTYTGPGTLVINGTNTYSGNTYVSFGTLVAGNTGALPAGHPIFLYVGATLAIGADADLGNSTTGVNFVSGGALQFQNYTSNLSFSNVANLGLGAAAGALSTLGGNITGSSGFNYLGPGTLVLTGNNSYSGDTNIQNGTLSITGSFSDASGNALISNTVGATAAATVSGPGAVWTHSGLDFVVGYNGSGSLAITAGGQVNCTSSADFVIIGFNSGSSGTVTVSGSGSQWIMQAQFNVGYLGSATLLIENGGTVTSGNEVTVGGFVGTGTANVTLTGAGSRWTIGNEIIIGGPTPGTVTVSAGATGSCVGPIAIADVGSPGGGTGYMTLTGSGTSWTTSTAGGTTNGQVLVGGSGTGFLIVTDGAMLNTFAGTSATGSSGIIGGAPGVSGTGTITVSAGGTWTGDAVTRLGFTSGSSGTLNIISGGVVNDSAGSVGYIAGGAGAVLITGAGSLWNNTSTLDVGTAGAGSLTISLGGRVNATTLTVGQNGTLTASGPATVSGAIVVNAGGTLAAASGAALAVSGGLSLAAGSISGFTLSAAGANSATPLVNLTSGTLTAANGSLVNISGAVVAGTYDLYGFANGSGPTSATNFSLNTTAPSGQTWHLATNAGDTQLDLIVTSTNASANWNSNGDGNFGDITKWSPNVTPNGTGLTATFGVGVGIPVNAAMVDVTIDGSYTAGTLAFSNSTTQYMLSSGAGTPSITLFGGGSGASVTVGANQTHNINTTLILSDAGGTTFTIASGGALNIGGTLQSSSNLSKQGDGVLTINGPPQWNSGAALQIGGGTLKLNVTSGAPTIAAGLAASVASGSTLELAGSISQLTTAVNIANSGMLLDSSGANQNVGAVTGTGSVVVNAGGSLTAYEIRQNALTISGTGKVTLLPSGSGSTMTPAAPNNINFSGNVGSLSIGGTMNNWTGTLDIGNNGLVIQYGGGTDPYATIANLIHSGYANGNWTGAGITSSLARAAVLLGSPTPALNIGLIDFVPNGPGFGSSIVFEGQTITTRAVLVRLTYMDDLELAGDMAQANATSDALFFAANYGSGTTWHVGDITHDGVIDTNDALLFAANYVVGLPSLDGTSGNAVALGGDTTGVAEPSSAALACFAVVGMFLLDRRRRRSRAIRFCR